MNAEDVAESPKVKASLRAAMDAERNEDTLAAAANLMLAMAAVLEFIGHAMLQRGRVPAE